MAEENKIKYTKDDQKKIKKLVAAGVELDGTESPEVLDTMLQEQVVADRDEEIEERQAIPGVPEELPIRTEMRKVGAKDVSYPVHFVAVAKGGHGLYNEFGVRIGFASNDDKAAQTHLAKAAARNNAFRWDRERHELAK